MKNVHNILVKSIVLKIKLVGNVYGIIMHALIKHVTKLIKHIQLTKPVNPIVQNVLPMEKDV